MTISHFSLQLQRIPLCRCHVTYQLLQAVGSTIMLFWKTWVYQHSWHIREQLEHNVTFALLKCDLVWEKETLGEHRNMLPVELNHLGIHKTHTPEHILSSLNGYEPPPSISAVTTFHLISGNPPSITSHHNHQLPSYNPLLLVNSGLFQSVVSECYAFNPIVSSHISPIRFL